MPYGYTGKLLRVNLTERRVQVEERDEVYYRRYFGGWGIILETLLREMPPGVDPLGPENILVFATGVVSGVPLSGSARNAVGAKSPLTGGFGVGEVGGFWGSELKRAGYDAIIVEGQASEPVYLAINDDAAELRDAGHLWGLSTKETMERVREEMREPRARFAGIGPGGENLVRYACIINDLKDAAGRCGLGAVMGSKRLKCIAVRGTQDIPVADADKVRELARFMARGVAEGELAVNMHKYGTGVDMAAGELSGNLPVRNWQGTRFPQAKDISAETLADTIRVGMEACYACAVRCKKVVSLEQPYRVDPAYGGPEYETIAAVGSNCGVSDLAAISKASELCNAYSLDTIAAGSAVAFGMEAFERGLLTTDDTGGLELRFGSGEALVQAIELIARRQGIGDLLAEGPARAAERLGRGAEQFAVHVKGQDLPMHEPRYKRALAISYAISPTGADHCHAVHDTGYTEPGGSLAKAAAIGILEPIPLESLGPEKVRLTIYGTLQNTLYNILVTCMFVPWTPDQQVEIVRAVTGWNATYFELMKAAERAFAMARAFNYREGFRAEDDRLPPRSHGPRAEGALTDGGIDPQALRDALDMYYAMMGWNEDGCPTRARLAELDVAWVADRLESR
ncbi:MAG: aldehyde ferredoxin oxidoreductase family protein [Anaerolineae bacterium]|nr:aldehyde ferredoxin oxidoreductase family protein [Anaerolineae bacterium]